MNTDKISQLIRSHSRLTGALKGNFDTWIGDPGTLARLVDVIPAPGPHERRLLEIGCYQPSIGYYFSLGWAEVIGIFKQRGEGALEETYVTDSGATARLAMADVETEALDVPSQWADAVLMMEVLEHFAIDPMQALWEANRVLKPGGRLVVTTPNAASWRYARRIARGQAPWAGLEFTGCSTDRHNRLYDVLELPEILGQAGFRIVSCRSKDYGNESSSLQEAAFRACLHLLDFAGYLVSGRRRERGQTLVIHAVKDGEPRERFPRSLYLTAEEWPGIAEERESMIARRSTGGR